MSEQVTTGGHQSPIYPEPPRRGASRGVVAAIAATTLVVGAVAGGGVVYLLTRDSSKPSHSNMLAVRGSLTLTDLAGYNEDGSGGCTGKEGYDDIRTGANVVIRDDKGTSLAIGSLGAGTKDTTGCKFDFAVTGVPKRGALYSIAIGNRDPYDFKAADATALALTLG